MVTVNKLGNRRFSLSWDWTDVVLELDWNPLIEHHQLQTQQGICIHWQAKPRSEAVLGFGKKSKFGRSWGIYIVHQDEYLTPPDFGVSNKGVQIPSFYSYSCEPIDVAEESVNGKNPVAVLWFPKMTAQLKNKTIVISKIK